MSPSIQWYPGHMTKARREMGESIPSQDVIIEVLDARMPRASENPIVTELRRQKPCIKVLSKSDLADPAITQQWLRHFAVESAATDASSESPGGPQPDHGTGKVVALAVSAERASEAKARIPELCKVLAQRRSGPGQTIRAMIVGVPNVGKSTLINTLMERRVANVGDEPAVTKGQQQVTLKNGMTLSDNPGILWPKIDDGAASFRLALGGAIPDSAIDYEPVALFGARFFLERYPALLRARFKLEQVPAEPEELLNEIGRRRGCLRSGGVVDLHKAADILIHEFRTGKLGRISLESPGDE
ncbi:MAG TPA: YlqF/YawG family GTPase [Polyangiaceae bacterium]|nr:YlqF/YawG family GTPase [Polyangiaceae bacterium]